MSASKTNTETEDEQVYGNCEGPDSMYMKLISCDGYEFILKKDVAMLAKTISNIHFGPSQLKEDETNKINLKEIPSYIVVEVCKYLIYKAQYTNALVDIPQFPVKPEVALEMLLAADFLNC